MQNLFLILSAGLMIGAVVPYLVDVIRKKTKPRVVSWGIWTLLMLIAGFAALDSGAIASAVVALSSALSTGLVAVFGYKTSDKTFTKLDIFSLSGAAVGLGLWWMFNSPLTAIIMSVVVDFIGAVPTVWHAYKKPQEETPLAFIMYFLSAACALLAIQEFSITTALVPLYLLIIDGSIATLIIMRKRKKVKK